MSSQIRFNKGRTLLHLANHYPTIEDVIEELVQNALDEQATRIVIKINFRDGEISVADDGRGTTIDRFNEALSSVAEPGRKEKGSLGQFGIGLISPLGKCQRFIFTSCPRPQKYGFQEWVFETSDIVRQRDAVAIPCLPRPDLTLDERDKHKTLVPWRSKMMLYGISTDAFISKITMDGLVGNLCDRFANVMRRNKVSIHVAIVRKDGTKEERPNVIAPQFRGRKLPEVVVRSIEAGEICFRLFLSPRSGRTGPQGRVLMGVGGDDFRFPFHLFTRATSELLGEEVTSALSSGLFEGEIVAEKVTLSSTRRAFNKDEPFLGLCVAIEQWFADHGLRYLDEAKQCREDERLQSLGLRSIGVFERLLKNYPVLASLLEVIRGCRIGTVGDGHTEPNGHKIRGETDKVLSTAGQPGRERDQASGGENRERDQPQGERNITHFTVGGPRGGRRRLVKGATTGLQFCYEAMESSSDLWRFDEGTGILTFNIRHPSWVACDQKSDVTLMRFQELVALTALTLQTAPETIREPSNKVTEELLATIVPWLVESDRLRGLSPGRRPAK